MSGELRSSSRVKSEMRETGIIKIVLFYWVIRVLKPEWIIAYYIPPLGFLKLIPTIFLICFVIYLFFSRKRIEYDWSILFFVAVMFVSTIFSANRGISYGFLRGMAETLICSCIMLTFMRDESDIAKLFKVYVFAFSIFAVWGIVGGGRVRACLPLEDEDSFGPFMAVGTAVIYHLHFVQTNRRKTRWYLTLSGLSLFGAIVSFARGTFVSLVGVIGYIFHRSQNKSLFVARVILLVGVGLVVVTLISPQVRVSGVSGDSASQATWLAGYLKEISTIWTQGAQEETANHRLYLWAKAWEMFLDHPFFGIGPGCYGYRISMYENLVDRGRWGMDRQPYGRAIHNIYFQTLAEMGIFGVLALFFLIYTFVRRAGLIARRSAEQNRVTYGHGPNSPNQSLHTRMHYYSMGLLVGMIAFLINGIFFNLLYFTWFWDLLIMNSLIFRKAAETESTACVC